MSPISVLLPNDEEEFPNLEEQAKQVSKVNISRSYLLPLVNTSVPQHDSTAVTETSAEFYQRKVKAIWTEVVEKGFKPDIILEPGLERRRSLPTRGKTGHSRDHGIISKG